MMKLLKYDWKRNANTFSGIAVVLVIVQTLLAVIGNIKGWDERVMIAFSVMLYLAAGIILLVLVCKTFEANIKAYNRRLLPVHPARTLLSSLLLGMISAAAFGVIMLVHALIYIYYSSMSFNHFLGLASWKDWLLLVLAMAWNCIFLLLILFTSITIGASISVRGKAGTWIGIFSFFVIITLMSWFEGLLFGNSDSSILGYKVFQAGTNDQVVQITSGSPILDWAPFLMEALYAGMMFYAVIYLLSKKIKI
ncbi:hypothetical protein DFP94_11515 [Fontibacillus phaseoli]|uniref:ABC-2 type transport system permease protein n=1 Tax=Fontibacillus phaseoli TaxID=1416533 RepID=A0A369B0W3_9BACL|nr:hypothetical protein [Fontibacillus phaseoli]RCX15332.1 hypothetical protein DFP94_11515 [Fontibacillus phaseoli]